MSSTPPRQDGSHCFVCGPYNPVGLRIAFRLDGNVCRGEFRPGPDHCGFDGVTHGGIIFSMLDDVMGNWLFLRGTAAYTARCETRYREKLPTETLVRLEGRVLKRKGRIAVMQGLAIRDDTDTVVAEAEARFMIADESNGDW